MKLTDCWVQNAEQMNMLSTIMIKDLERKSKSLGEQLAEGCEELRRRGEAMQNAGSSAVAIKHQYDDSNKKMQILTEAYGHCLTIVSLLGQITN